MESGTYRRCSCWVWLIPLLAILCAGIALWFLYRVESPVRVRPRLPGQDLRPPVEAGTPGVFQGQLSMGDGIPAPDARGGWPCFRGVLRDGVSADPLSLLENWDAKGPPVCWSLEVAEGYAGPAVWDGCVYLLDYDRARQADTLRVLSLADGKEIWRFAYPVVVKRNHGISRTVPAVSEKWVVTLGPKCMVVCWDRLTGECRWNKDLVREYGTVVPPWYAGQCPLLDQDRVILAPGGTNALLLAVECETGNVLWQTPNPRGWKMSHASITPMTWNGRRLYLYCAGGGVIAVDARDGTRVWETDEWKISIATVPSPVGIPPDRILFAGGYNSGSMLVQLGLADGIISPQVRWRLKPEVFGADMQTPLCFEGLIYGVRPDGQLVCMDPDGVIRWTSGPQHRFGLGPYLLADRKIYALNDTGRLSVIRARADRFELLCEARVLEGHDAWGPMAIADGRLLARDLTRLVCLDLTAR